jgi:small subunit ribosomal protein S13
MGVTRVKAPEEEKDKKPKPKKVEKKVKPKEITALVRIAGTNLDGEKPLVQALMGIKGISHTMSRALCTAAGFDPKVKLGSLDDKEKEKLEEVIKDPLKFGIPSSLVNRKKDMDTGKDLHLTGADLDIKKKFDVQKTIDMKSYKGVRHMYGLPVRGQRTRSSFRKGREVGVMRKAVKLQMREKEKKK